MKNDITGIDESIFRCVCDFECDAELYKSNYDKSMELAMKKVTFHYHPNKETLQLSAETNPSTGNTYIQ